MRDSGGKKTRCLRWAAIDATALAFCSHLFLRGWWLLVLEVLACLLAIGWFVSVLVLRQGTKAVKWSLLLLGFALFMISYHLWSAHHYALVAAIAKGDVTAMERLIAKGYDVNANTGGGQNLLTWTFWYPYHGRSREIDAARAKVTQSEREAKILQMLTVLLDGGAEVNNRDPHGETPLNLAASRGYLTVVKMLLERGADVNMAGSDGWTPLHSAVQSGNLELVKLLLEEGADPNRTEDRGLTPLRVAEECSMEAIAHFLESVAGRGQMEPDKPLLAPDK